MTGASVSIGAFALSLLLQGMLCASASAAATAAAPPPAEELETIVITGSNVKDSEVQKALPVQVIDREAIDRSGARTAEQVLRQVSANLIGESPATSLNSGTPGLSSANLRGIGSGSTLVLINGHRSANYALDGGTVDLGSIPLAAVQRIEVLKDGASAIYGADAMAGVINFILRPDYEGAEATARATATQHGGGEQQQATASFGYGELARDGFNAFLTVDWQHYDTLSATDRPFSSSSLITKPDGSGLSSRTSPANIVDDNGHFLNPTYATGCAPPLSVPKPGRTYCGYDYVRQSDIVPPTKQIAAVAGATLNAGAAGQLSMQLIYSRNDYTLRLAPTAVSPLGTLGKPVLYPADGPYYPTAFAAANGLSGDLNLLWRLDTLGSRTDDVVADSLHGTVALDGQVRGWDYDAALIYSRNNQTDTLASGYVSTSKFLPALYTGTINPFGPLTPAGEALLESTQISPQQSGTGTTWSLEAKGSRTLRELSHGRLAMATGIELRREELSNRYTPEFAAGDILSETGTFDNTTSTREVAALYAELNVPLATGAMAQLAARYDHFSDFGGSVNPKVALSWQLGGGVLLRASWGTGFRPPTLYDLHTPVTIAETFSFNNYSDPIRCPVTQLGSDCTSEFVAHVGGNPDLEPEKSHQFNAGIVWSGYSGISIGADYWQLHKTQTIGTLDADTVLSNYDAYGHYVERGPVDPAYPTLPGPITYLDLRMVNLGDLNTSGIDVNIEMHTPPTAAGRFALRMNGTWVNQWEQQLDGLNFSSGVGQNLVGAVPRWRHYLALDWDWHEWAATLAENYSAGYGDYNPVNDDGSENRVASYKIWNCQVSYRGIRHTLLAAGVNNVFDANPPFSNQASNYQVGYDPHYADPLGRVYYGTVTYTFK